MAVLGVVLAVFPSHVDAKAVQLQPTEGRVLFVKYCASCHGASGHGDGPAADALRVKPADLTQFATRNGGIFPNERTRRMIDGRESGARAHGNIEMPVWGDEFQVREGLTETAARSRIEAIVNYIGSIQQRSGD
jgi:mono/diheme cytochrome c family protein